MADAELKTRSLHPVLGAEILGISLKEELDSRLAGRILSVLNQSGVVAIRGQDLSDDDLMELCTLMGGQWRMGNALGSYSPSGVSPLSNIDAHGNILSADDKTRAMNIANQLWHTDSTYARPGAAASFLFARVVPPTGGETEFCDTRHAYDRLSPEMRARVDPLFAHHSLNHSRRLTGVILEEWDTQAFKGSPAIRRPLVRVHPGSGRKALCIAAHIESIDGLSYEEAQDLVNQLIGIAAAPGCVYTHHWRVGDLLIWDNRCTMHRARPYREFDDVRHMRTIRTVDPTDV